MHLYSTEFARDLFTPAIIVPVTPTAGEDFNITCRLDGVVERLVVGIVTLGWFLPPAGTPGMQTRDGTAYTISLQFTPVVTSNTGTYECVARIQNIPSLTVLESQGGDLLVQSNVMLRIVTSFVVHILFC